MSSTTSNPNPTTSNTNTTSNPGTNDNLTLTPSELHTLSLLAIRAKRNAYCPYSNFRVGASIISDPPSSSSTSSTSTSSPSSPIYTSGSNVEVASTPIGICAERCALAPLVASYARPAMPRIRGIAVATDIWPPSSPCGMCRQMMREFCSQEVGVWMFGREKRADGEPYREDMTDEEELRVCGEPLRWTVGQLLPLSFGPEDLLRGQGK